MSTGAGRDQLGLIECIWPNFRRDQFYGERLQQEIINFL
jgi:hypothetical protein